MKLGCPIILGYHIFPHSHTKFLKHYLFSAKFSYFYVSSEILTSRGGGCRHELGMYVFWPVGRVRLQIGIVTPE